MWPDPGGAVVRIVDPTQGRTDAGLVGPATGHGGRLDGRVCLLSNAKPNASALLEATARQLGLSGSTLLSKATASVPAPDDLLARIAADFDSALVAIGD
jgi:hypothetical protein